MFSAQELVMKPRVPRYSRAEKYPKITITPTRLNILQAIARFRYLSEPQIRSLFFSPASRAYCCDHLMKLYHAGYLERVLLMPPNPKGSPLFFYCLDSLGMKTLSREGIEVGGRGRPSESKEVGQLYLRH